MYVHQGNCVAKCPEGFFIDEDDENIEGITEARKCKECSPEGCPKGTQMIELKDTLYK